MKFFFQFANKIKFQITVCFGRLACLVPPRPCSFFLSCSKKRRVEIWMNTWRRLARLAFVQEKKRPAAVRNLFDQHFLLFFYSFPFLVQVLHQHNDTLSRLEAASKSAYSYALGITVGLGGILCFLNGMLLLCLCQKRSASKRRLSKLDDPTGTLNNSIASASAVDYLVSQPQTPQVHHAVHQRNHEFSSLPRHSQPQQVGTATTGRSGGQRAAVIVTSGGPPQHRYRTFQSSR